MSIPAAPVTTTITAPDPRAGGFCLPALTLWQREMVRFFRQRNRVVGALATPIVFWLLLGSGLNRSFTLPTATPSTPTHQDAPTPPPAPHNAPHDSSATRVGYLEYFYPGTMVLILLFTAIFSTISVIEDRREGFLQGVLVAPIPRLSIVTGKVLGGAAIATLQGVLFLAVWPVVGHWPGLAAMTAAVATMFVLAAGLTAMSLCMAWPLDSTAGFHAVMNLLLMPMWFLSGAVFPLDSAPGWMRVIMWGNPLTYGQSALSALLAGPGGASPTAPIPLGVSILVMVVFTGTAVLLAGRVVSRPRKDGSA